VTYQRIASSADRQRWLEARKRYITASEVASILGVGFNTPAQLAEQKRSEVVDVEEDEVGNLAMVAAGRHLESGVLAWFAAETPHLEFETNNHLLARSGDALRTAATPDAIMDAYPVEAKMVRFEAFSNWTKFGSRDEYACYEWASDIVVTNIVKRFPPITMRVAKKDWGTPRGNWRAAVVEAYTQRLQLGPLQPPLKYVVQLHVQMYVMDAPHGWITGCVGGDTRLDFQVARSAKLEQHWMTETQRFIEEIGGLPT
jgi:hypothetical protein